MSGALLIAVLIVAGLFVTWCVAVAVYLVGAKIKPLIDAHEHVQNRTAIWGWGLLYSVAGLIVLALLVRFVKLVWVLE